MNRNTEQCTLHSSVMFKFIYHRSLV